MTFTQKHSTYKVDENVCRLMEISNHSQKYIVCHSLICLIKWEMCFLSLSRTRGGVDISICLLYFNFRAYFELYLFNNLLPTVKWYTVWHNIRYLQASYCPFPYLHPSLCASVLFPSNLPSTSLLHPPLSFSNFAPLPSHLSACLPACLPLSLQHSFGICPYHIRII